MNKRMLLFGFLFFFISGCASAPKIELTTLVPAVTDEEQSNRQFRSVPKIDLTTFLPDREPKIRIPLACKSKYDAPLPLVVVTNFTTNTSFDYANVVQSQVQGSGQRTAVGGAAVGVAPGAAGVVWGTKERSSFQANSQTVSRQVNAKLSESIEDGVMDEIVNMGGAKVCTRKEMDKIFSEQKFQQSGMVDDSTLVSLGKLKGVKYIITGSVNNVDLKWASYQSARQSLGKGGSGNLAVDIDTQEGWNIGTEVTVRILDVETGEVVLSKKMTGKHIIGKIPYPNYDTLIRGIKKAAGKSLRVARPELSKYFPAKGFVTMIKNSPDGKERAVRVSVGEKVGIKSGSELFVYTFEGVEEPISGKKECDVQRLPVSLIVSSDHVQPNAVWALVDANKPEQLRMIRVGQLVEVSNEDKKQNLYAPAKGSRDFVVTAKDAKPEDIQLATGLNVDVDIRIPKGKDAGKNDIALIIGNRHYTGRGVPEVTYADRDARVMREYMVQTFGFKAENVIYEENATLSKFNELFGTENKPKGKLFNWTKKGANLFIYYAGHGAPDLETQDAYFVPVDANPQYIATNGYRLQTFYANIGKIQANKITVVIDACFSGNSDRGFLFKEISPALVKVKTGYRGPQNALVMTSAAEDQVSSWYKDKRHSLFTYYFLKGVQGEADVDGDSLITVGEMKAYLTENVPHMARRLSNVEQTPIIVGDDYQIFVSLKK